MLLDVFIADVADEDEVKISSRREDHLESTDS